MRKVLEIIELSDEYEVVKHLYFYGGRPPTIDLTLYHKSCKQRDGETFSLKLLGMEGMKCICCDKNIPAGIEFQFNALRLMKY